MRKMAVILVLLLMTGFSVTAYAQETSNANVIDSVSDNTPDQTEDVEETQSEEMEESEESMSGNDVETETGDKVSEEGTEEPIIADGSFYYLQGTVQNGGHCFVSDITIYPTGVDGFIYIRQGEEEEFAESIVISQDAINGVISLQFSDGSRMTESMELTYSKDTQIPLITEVLSEKETLIENVILLTTPELCVYAQDVEEVSEDGNRISGSGIEAVYCKYDGTENRYELEDGKAVISLPDSFYGDVEIWCNDYAGNSSQTYNAAYLTDVTKPQVTISTNVTKTELTHDEILVEIMDAGEHSTGIQSVVCSLNEAVSEPELTITPKEVTVNEEGQEIESAVVYSFVLQITDEISNLSLQVTDCAGNMEECSYTITKEAKPEAYQMEVPKRLDMIIDPFRLMGEEQIVSEGNIVKNLNDFPVKISITQFEYTLNRENFADGIVPCELKLSIEGNNSIAIEEGITEKITEFVLEPQEQRDIRFGGSIANGTESLWRAGDISIKFVCEFEKVRNLIVEKINE